MMTWNADDAARMMFDQWRGDPTVDYYFFRRHLQAAHDAARTPWTTSDRLAAEAWADWNSRAPDSRETLHMWLARWLQVVHDAAVSDISEQERGMLKRAVNFYLNWQDMEMIGDRKLCRSFLVRLNAAARAISAIRSRRPTTEPTIPDPQTALAPQPPARRCGAD